MCFCCESVFLVCAVAEGHEGGSAAPAPGLDNLPVDYDQVGTVLGRTYYNVRHTHTITSLPIIVLGP